MYKNSTNFAITTTFINIHSRALTLQPIFNKLSSKNPSTTNTLKVHICTQNQIFEATLALSNTKKQEKESTTAYSPFSFFDDTTHSTCPTLEIPQSLFDQEAMDSLHFPPKSAAFSNSVHSSDGSLISVFNTEAVPTTSPTYTNLEPSFDLSIGDPSFIQQLLDNTNLTSPLPDLDLESDFFADLPEDPLSFDSFLNFDPNMTIQELTNVPMEQQEISSTLPISTYDDSTISSVSSQVSDEPERDEVNRRGMKKSGGPVRKLARFGNKQVIKYSEEYHDRRIKNNEAVKKSRMKAKEKQQTTDVQMNQLTEENRALNDRVDLLMKELQVLRSLYKELKQDVPSDSLQTMARVNTH